MKVDNAMKEWNIIMYLKSIDSLSLFFFLWLLLSVFINGDYSNFFVFVSDINLRNILLIFFYYSLSRLFFHHYRIFSYYVTIAIMLIFALREGILCLEQIVNGLSSPVGTMLNPGIVGCFFSIVCSVLFVEINKIQKRGWRLFLGLLLCPFIVIILFTKSRLALLALITSVLCFFSLSTKNSAFVKKNIVLIVISLVALFSVLYYAKKPSADGRVYMAKIAVMSILHNGVWGSGIDSYSGRFGEEQFKYYSDCNKNEKVDISSVVDNDLKGSKYACSPATAFNEFLRLGVENGVIAMLLSLLIIIKSIIVLLKNNDALGYGLLSLFIFSLFSYPHCFAIFCLLLSLFIGAASSQEMSISEDNYQNFILIHNYVDILLLGLMLYSELPQLKVKSTISNKKDNITFMFKYEDYDNVCHQCAELYDGKHTDLDLLYMYGVSLSMTGESQKSDFILHMGASRCSDPIFWQEIGHNYFRSAKYEDAENSYLRSFLMVPNRITPLLYLAQLYYHTGDKEKLDKIVEFSDSFVPKVPSGTTREYQKRIKQFANGE